MNLIIGLTGGIAAGKSTVAGMLARRGAVIIDADRVAHEVYAPATEGYEHIVERFGHDIVGEDDAIDRTTLGGIVFGDRKALADLNAIIHPLVRKEIARRLLAIAETSPDAVVVIEAALMTETGWSGGGGILWAVVTSPDVAVDRLVEMRGMTHEEAQLRLGAQTSNEERRKVATRVIENDGTLENLEAEVATAWRELLEYHHAQ